MNYSVLSPQKSDPEEVLRQNVLLPFSPEVVEFIGEFSRVIMKDHSLREFPEVIALAFWMRKASLAKLEKTFEERRLDAVLLGRGVVFHIAPANVDTIFIYSLFMSMLAGNVNIVRVSGKKSPILNVLLGVLNKVTDSNKFEEVRKRFLVVQYEHNDEITGYFSQQCDARVTWGGDETIRRIRAIPIKPTALELTFADKFSFCILNAAEVLQLKDFEALSVNFYNDSYWFRQMACSSLRLVVWIGDNETIEKARELFWKHIEETVEQKQQEISAASAVDKLAAQYSMAVEGDSVTIVPSSTNRVNRVLLASPGDLKRELHCGSGLFFELKLKKIDDISQFVTRKDQTMGYFGFDVHELKQMVLKNKLKGIDRIVPLGKALDFSHIWDGFDLLRELCREVYIT
jgi:hypothetical protein